VKVDQRLRRKDVLTKEQQDSVRPEKHIKYRGKVCRVLYANVELDVALLQCLPYLPRYRFKTVNLSDYRLSMPSDTELLAHRLQGRL
jgi:hypothetical protein